LREKLKKKGKDIPPNSGWSVIYLKRKTKTHPTTDEVELSTFDFISAKDCLQILKTCRLWLPEYIKASKDFGEEFGSVDVNAYPLWKLMNEVSDLLGLNDDQLHALQREPNNESYQKQKEVFYKFGKLLSDTYPTCKGWYFHLVVCHTTTVSI
jgi:hypothetical protein